MQIVTTVSVDLSSPAPLTLATRAFRQLRAQLNELDGCARETALMEEEQDIFLETYYARVLPLTARLERLRYRKTHGIFPPSHIMGELFAPRSKQEHGPLAKRKKELFRRLVKRCHPDNARGRTPVTISEVYEAETVGALWLLEIICFSDALASAAEVTMYLASQQAEIDKAMRDAREYNLIYAQSDVWQLKEQVYNAALDGEDLIEQIQQRIEAQIAALQQYFAKPQHFKTVA